MSLAAGGGAIAALLGFVLYKRRQKKDSSEAEHSVGPLTVTSASGTPSIFGTAGGRSVDTSASAIQTDFSQSGLSAIDTDEGVDPVAEADVYMAYGRDAQAEEILLDALKNDPDRNAIRLKLLEIYAQRKNMLQFETVAGELYARTGGSGMEWEKAATLGQMLDPHNPLYARGPREEAARPVVETPPPAYEPEPEAAPLADTWARSSGIHEAAAAQQGGEMPFVTSSPQPDEPAEDLDFDLGLDFHEGGEAEPPAELAEEEEQSFDSTAWMGMNEAAPADSHEEHDHSFDSTVVLGAGVPRFGADPFAGEDFHIDLGDHPDEGEGVSANMDSTAVRGDFLQSAASPPIEQPTLDLGEDDVQTLDFDLGDDVGGNMPSASYPPAMDLSGISLDMEEAHPAPQAQASFAPEATVARDAFRPYGMEEAPEPAQEVEPLGQEMDFTDMFSEPEAESAPLEEAEPDVDPTAMEEAGTKLELAQAYEEMGDREGARDLLQEVVQEGSKSQKEKASAILARLA
jgi:pilus assembly protein FimV